MQSGAAKVQITEQELAARAGAARGIYIGMALPAVRGPLTPSLVTHPEQFLQRYAPTGRVLVGYDTAYLEALTALEETNKLWVIRAVKNAKHGGAYIRNTASSLVNAATEFGFIDPDSDYDLQTVDGRSLLAPASVTFDVSQDVITVPQTVYDLIATGDTFTLTTTGTLPLPLQAATTYYAWKSPVSRKIGIASSAPNASSATILNITSFGIGTHTITVSGKTVAGSFTADTTFDQLTLPSTLYAAAATGDAVQLTTTTTLPAGLSLATTYYVIKTLTANTVKLATTLNNATAGTAIDITTVGTGTHTLTLSNKALDGTFDADMSDDTLTVTPAFYTAVGTGDAVQPALLTGSFPTGVNGATVYYAIKQSVANKIKLATTLNNANNGVALAFSGDGAGTYTLTNNSITAQTLTDSKVLTFHGADPGLWNNDIGIKLTNYGTNPTKVKEPDSFLVEVYYKNAQVEQHICSRDANKKDGRGQSIYVEEVLKSSNYIRALDNVTLSNTILPKEQATVLSLAGGTDGDPVTDAVMIEALQKLSSPSEIPLALVPDSGWCTPAYQTAIVNLCEQRGDCAFIFSTPYEVEASSDYLNAIITYKQETLASESSYGGIWSSHLLVQDRDNNRQLYVAPSAHVAGRIARMWDRFEAWQPGAGNVNGRLNVLGVHCPFTDGEMDALYDANVNPIRWQRGKGATIWGYKTLQTRPSDLDRMNARLLLCVIRPAISDLLESYLFDLSTVENDASTRASISASLDNYMSSVKARRGVYDYRVVCSEVNNTSEDVDQHILRVWLLIKMTKTVEYIPFTLGITPYGIEFDVAQTQLGLTA